MMLTMASPSRSKEGLLGIRLAGKLSARRDKRFTIRT